MTQTNQPPEIVPQDASLNNSQERQLNQAAFRQLREVIQRTYPAGRFVAIAQGKIVADAASFAELDSLLHQMGNHSADVLVVQARIDYPESVTIFAQALRA
jgi:hypothetical protein